MGKGGFDSVSKDRLRYQSLDWLRKQSKMYHSTPTSFRYFDLPIEIRYNILENLLVRGKVAMRSCLIRQRFPSWRHASPQWSLLKGVSRQMQREASDVVFSSKNTFFSPLGAICDEEKWFLPNQLPPIKKLDCVFDMRDINEASFWTFQHVKQWHDSFNVTPDIPFESLSSGEKLELLHGSKRQALMYDWVDKVKAVFGLELELLRFDLTDCRCPAVCCRLGEGVLSLISHDENTSFEYPKRLEIVGALKTEEKPLRAMLRRCSDLLEERVIFIDTPGCSCTVS